MLMKCYEQSLEVKTELGERIRIYLQLYLAQFLLAKHDWDNAIETLTKTFNEKKLCSNENYVVFAITIMKRLMRVSQKAVPALLKTFELLHKEIGKPKDDRSAAVLLYIAGVAVELGTKGYEIANKIYETLLPMVFGTISSFRNIRMPS